MNICFLGAEGKREWDYIPYSEHKHLHFDNAQDIHTRFKNHEESGYGLDSELRTTSSWVNACVLYRRRSGLVGEKVTI